MNIADWGDDALQRFGDELAVVDADGRPWTRGELVGGAARFAAALAARGVAPGDRVVVALPSGGAAVVAAMGAWRAGGVVVYVNPEAPESELRQIVDHCEPRAVVDSAAAVAEAIARHQPLATVARAPDDPAQLVYTSGTTGRVKAAIYCHHGMDSYMTSRRTLEQGSPPAVALVALPPTAFAGHLLIAWWTGRASLRVHRRFDPYEVLAAIERDGITRLSLVPTMASALVATGRRPQHSALREVLISGAHTPPALADSLEQLLGVRPAVSYGMTEVGGAISWTTSAARPGSVGRITPGVEVRIVDDAGTELPRGEPGEVRVRSPWMARGYWRDPDETAAVFRDGWVHTGDLGRHDADGELFLVGRSKDLIIQAGYNVAPRDVAEVIDRLAGVAQCAVVGLPHDVLGEEVVACIVRAPGSTLASDDVFAHCRAHLDARKQPGRVVFFDKLPTSANGKIKLAELRELAARAVTPAAASPSLAELQTATPERRVELVRDEIVRLVAACRTRAGARTPVDPEATFEDLGLSSMERVQMLHELSGRLQRQVVAALVYRHPTPSSLAARLASELDAATATLETDVLAVERTSVTSQRATTAQVYFWRLEQQDPEPTSFISPVTYLLEGALDREALQRAVADVVARHSIFRTAFRERAGQLMQELDPAAPRFELELVANPAPGAEPSAIIDRVVADLIAGGLDLAAGRTIRGRLLELAPDRHALVLIIHHIVTDAASTVMLVEEIFARYAGAPEPAPPLQHIDYTDALERFAQTPTGRARQAWWHRRLEGATPVPLPYDSPREELDALRDAAPLGIVAERQHPIVMREVPAEVRAKVTRVAKAEGTTAAVVYLACYAWLLRTLSGHDDLCIENVYSPRAEYGIEAVQGPIGTLTLLRLDAAGCYKLRAFISRAKDLVVESLDKGLIHDYWGTVPANVRGLFYNYHPPQYLVPQVAPSQLQIVPQRRGWPVYRRHWDVFLLIMDLPQTTLVNWTANARLFREPTVRVLADRYHAILERQLEG